MSEKSNALRAIVDRLPKDLREAYINDSEFHHLVMIAASKEIDYLEFMEETSSYYAKIRAKEREEAYKRSAESMSCAKSFDVGADTEKDYSATYASGYNDGRVSMMKQNVICLIIVGIIIAIFN